MSEPWAWAAAFTAAVDDYSAIFYNPAYLARMEESDTNLSLLHAGIDEKFPTFFSDLGSMSNSNDITQVMDFLEKILAIIILQDLVC